MISVIMAVYNAEKYLNECIESILNQTYKDFEFIIIDDCSTDRSFSIIQEYAKKNKKIKVINNKENLGLTKNLNKALLLSKGKYIARMDADDISESTRFERQIKFLEENQDIDIVGSFCTDIDEEGNKIGERKNPITHEDILKVLPKVNPVAHPTVMMRKKSLNKIDNYKEKFKKCQDYDLWFRAAANGLKMHNIPEYLFKYRINDSYTSRKSFEYRKIDFKIRFEGYRRLKLPLKKYIYLAIPIILGIIPNRLYKELKKLDPR